ncbi:hypothetical protein WAI453_005973 [Rhynchosporium graminicola]
MALEYVGQQPVMVTRTSTGFNASEETGKAVQPMRPCSSTPWTDLTGPGGVSIHGRDFETTEAIDARSLRRVRNRAFAMIANCSKRMHPV